MESWITGLPGHGYSLLFLIVFLEAVGLPIPAALALIVAGAAAARGSLNFALTATGSISAMLLGDTLMFILGRYTGWWLLGLLCRLSLNPESCILRSADSFYRRGRALLVIAKFLPGINTMAPPLAGSMNMRFTRFFGLDLCGAALYAGAYLLLGYIGSDVLGALTRGYQTVGQAVTWIFVAGVIVYIAIHLWMRLKARAWRAVPLVPPADAFRAVSTGAGVIYDVRSHGYYDRKALRIQGSRRLDPNTIPEFHKENVPEGKLVFLYCT